MTEINKESQRKAKKSSTITLDNTHDIKILEK